MRNLTISPNEQTKQIFLASEREDDYSEMLKFMGTLKLSKDTTFECKVGKTAITCTIKCSNSDYLKVLLQLQEKDEVKYIIEQSE